jgi:hypothetical protein
MRRGQFDSQAIRKQPHVVMIFLVGIVSNVVE